VKLTEDRFMKKCKRRVRATTIKRAARSVFLIAFLIVLVIFRKGDSLLLDTDKGVLSSGPSIGPPILSGSRCARKPLSSSGIVL